MRPSEICILIFTLIPTILILFIIIFATINEIKYKKIKKKYPKVFELIEERDRAMEESCEFYNENILRIKNKIDYILNEQKYITIEKSKSSNIELENLRTKLEHSQETYDAMNKKQDLLREEIEKIIKSNPDLLKEMKKYGWCKGE